MLKLNNKIILDTHILIWILISPDELSKKIIKSIEIAQNSNNLYISSISLWEIAMLIHKKRINVYERIADFINSITNIDGLNIININAGIAAESVALPGGFHSDPADCIIIASARDLAATLITRDQKIIDWSLDGHLKLIVG
jgi:PIN domain nuclease of toxin-antitoxin system